MLVEIQDTVRIDDITDLYDIIKKDWFNGIKSEDWLKSLGWDIPTWFSLGYPTTIELKNGIIDFLVGLDDWTVIVDDICKKANNILIIEAKLDKDLEESYYTILKLK